MAPMGGAGGKKRHPAKAIVAGGIAGAVEACISFPTECVFCACGWRRCATFLTCAAPLRAAGT